MPAWTRAHWGHIPHPGGWPVKPPFGAHFTSPPPAPQQGAFLVAQTIKNHPAMQKAQVHLWVWRSPGEGNGHPLQYSSLENSRDRGAWQATIHEVTKGQTRLSNFQLSSSPPRVGLPQQPQLIGSVSMPLTSFLPGRRSLCDLEVRGYKGRRWTACW